MSCLAGADSRHAGERGAMQVKLNEWQVTQRSQSMPVQRILRQVSVTRLTRAQSCLQNATNRNSK